MNIILIPGNTGKGKSASLPHRHLLLIVLVGGVFLPLLLGVITYRIQLLLEGHASGGNEIAAYSKELSRQHRALNFAKHEAATNLNALTLRLGQLQAQVLRLNALGGRLTRMAGLDAREFNFETEVAQGGPETGLPYGKVEIAPSLDRLSAELRASEERLKMLEASLLNGRLNSAPVGWPAEGGFVSSGFGQRTDPFTGEVAFHEGVDIVSRLGSPIKSVADGVVSFVGEKANYGLVIEITHDNGLITRYAHALSAWVKLGDKVTGGQPIAQVGTSGRSSGPHLHFEVLKNDKAVDPLRYLGAAR